jgi:hypothetical protein
VLASVGSRSLVLVFLLIVKKAFYKKRMMSVALRVAGVLAALSVLPPAETHKVAQHNNTVQLVQLICLQLICLDRTIRSVIRLTIIKRTFGHKLSSNVFSIRFTRRAPVAPVWKKKTQTYNVVASS